MENKNVKNTVLDTVLQLFSDKTLMRVTFTNGANNDGYITDVLKDGFVLTSDKHPVQVIPLSAVSKIGPYVPRADGVEYVGRG